MIRMYTQDGVKEFTAEQLKEYGWLSSGARWVGKTFGPSAGRAAVGVGRVLSGTQGLSGALSSTAGMAGIFRTPLRATVGRVAGWQRPARMGLVGLGAVGGLNKLRGRKFFGGKYSQEQDTRKYGILTSAVERIRGLSKTSKIIGALAGTGAAYGGALKVGSFRGRHADLSRVGVRREGAGESTPGKIHYDVSAIAPSTSFGHRFIPGYTKAWDKGFYRGTASVRRAGGSMISGKYTQK